MIKIICIYILIGCIWFIVDDLVQRAIIRVYKNRGINLTINGQNPLHGLIKLLSGLGAIFLWPIQMCMSLFSIIDYEKFKKMTGFKITEEKDQE